MWRRGWKAAGVIVRRGHDAFFRGRGCERRVECEERPEGARNALAGCKRAALLLLLSGGINDGVAESHRCVAIATPRGPPTSPRAAPNARGFFCIWLGPVFLSRSGGIKARLAESTRRVPHQRDPQTRRRNDAMAWSTPEVREVCVGMEVTSYLSAEM
jgi:coenzyme PQQ precursor peptide PqqA